MDIEEITDLCIKLGEKPFRAKQIFGWLHKNKAVEFSEMKNLPLGLISRLNNDAEIKGCKIKRKYESETDGTIKYLFEADRGLVEAVFMRYSHGNTVCISSQIGCGMGCRFCASTINGFVRNLTPGEMLSLVYEIEKDADKVSGVVIMGGGEPLLNFDNVCRFVKLINSKEGMNIGQRHITISTCGIAPKILELADLKLQVNLALSLHGADDKKRREIMPIAKKYPLKELFEALDYYTKITNRRITYEYTLIKDVNDTKKDSELLVNLLKNRLAHVNLIPLNEIKECEYKTSGKTKEFSKFLLNHGINVTVRRRLGEDVNGACGQLRNLQTRGE